MEHQGRQDDEQHGTSSRPSDERYRQLVESVSDYAIFMLDPDGRIASWNPGGERIKGYRPEEIIGQRYAIFFTPEDQAAGKPQRLLGEAKATGHVQDEGWRVRKDGTRFWAGVVVTAMRDEQGRLVGFSKVTRDLTERKLAEDQQRQFRLLVESVLDYAILMLDPEGHVTSWNPGAQRLKGYREEEIIGRHHRLFYLPEDQAAGKPERLLSEAAAQGRVEDESWRVRKDGTRFWADVVVTAVHDESGALVGFAKITRDLTERKRAETALAEHAEQLEEANQALQIQAEELQAQQEELQAQQEELQTQQEELQALNTQLHARTAELLELDALKDNFLAILSHELRTPLNAILGFASILDDELAGPLTPVQHAYIGKIMGGTDVLLALINDLLDMSRIQAGKFTLSPGRLAFAEVCREAIESLQPLAERKRQALRCETPDDLPVLKADHQRIFQVLVNLVSNAIKFSAEGQRVVVRAFPAGDQLRCEVVDQGVGIASEHLPRLFQRFSQLETGNTRSAGGTGLGLSISKALVEAHGGRIGVESAPGQGSIFWFTLPL
jgi:hypothetical protein